jgi:hypothetical protein
MKSIAFLFLLVPSFGWSQNLVPNPSFEEYEQCPYYFDSVNPINEWLYNWYSPNAASHDYFNECSFIEAINSRSDVPENAVGYQSAHSGLAYSGIFTNGDCLSQSNENLFREYLQVELLESLATDSIYHISFFVSRADSSSCNCNSIGILLTDSPVISNENTLLNFIPQLNNELDLMNSGEIWIEVSFTYIANGNESFLTIGNFKDNLNSDCASLASGSLGGAYYYIDDVTVIQQSQVQIAEIQSMNYCDIKIDIEGALIIESNQPFKNVKLIDQLGRIRFDLDYHSTNNTRIFEYIHSGNYFVLITLDNENKILRKILINKNQTR